MKRLTLIHLDLKETHVIYILELTLTLLLMELVLFFLRSSVLDKQIHS